MKFKQLTLTENNLNYIIFYFIFFIFYLFLNNNVYV